MITTVALAANALMADKLSLWKRAFNLRLILKCDGIKPQHAVVCEIQE